MKIYIPSLHRPHHVETMEGLAGEAELVWCVPEEQVEAYRAAGAQRFFTGHPGEFEKMNEVMDAHPDEWLVFSDDDCKGFKRLDVYGEVHPIDLGEAAAEMLRIGQARRDKYVALSQNTNQMFMRRTVTDWGQAANWLCCIAPGVPERWETGFASDLEFSAKMCMAYGRIARINHIIGLYQFNDAGSHWREWYRPGNEALVARLHDIADRYPALLTFTGSGMPKYARLSPTA